MGKKGNICVIMADVTEDYRDEYLLGVAKQAEKLNYVTTVFSMALLNQQKTQGEESVYDLIDFDKYDGVVFFEKSFSSNKSMGKRMERYISEKCNKPVVVLGNSTVFDDVFTGDYSRNIELLTDHIIEQHNCELLYFLGGYQGYATQIDVGFIHSLTKHGIAVTDDNMIYGGFWRQCAEKLAEDIAYGNVAKPDAVVCYSDIIAFFFIKALFRHGIRVPNDIIVTGFSASTTAQNSIISITTCNCDTDYLGRSAVSRLHALISGEEEPQIIRPRANIITGMSCGCGSNQHINIRRSLEMHEKRSVENTNFANSELDEKLFACRNIQDISEVISQTHYLIADKSSLAVCLNVDKNISRCLFMLDYIGKEDQVDFKSTDILPPNSLQTDSFNIIYVLPIVFNDKNLGHIVVCYNKPTIYNAHFKNYTRHIAVGLEVLRIRNHAALNTVVPIVQSEGEKKGKTLFAYSGETLHRISIDNVLYFETDGRKTVAALRSARLVVRSSLSQLEEQYSDSGFLRVSKSTLLNLTKVNGYSSDSDRTMIATLVGNVKIRISRKFSSEFKKRMANI